MWMAQAVEGTSAVGDVEDARAAARREADARWSGWMAAAQDGDGEAYRRLLDELLPVLGRIVRSRVHDRENAEDVVQNILLSIHRARHTYRPERSFGPWMRAIARNAMIDCFRETGRRGEREVVVEVIERFAPSLREALDQLPEAQREAVELVQLRGLSVVEAALEAGTTPGALKVRAHRGYVALRRLLVKGET
jgi:RNA polymerase sigma-70 factor (ECF subfamily)